MKASLLVIHPFLKRRLNVQILQAFGASSSSQKQSPFQTNRRSSESGLTLIECLVAIAVIGLTGAMIGPPLLLAAATRIQNQRAEQALQIAQGEVDRVRMLVERGEHTPPNLPAVGSITNLQAPSGLVTSIKTVKSTCPNRYNGAQLPINQALQIDVDGDCEVDFLMQVARTQGRTSTRESASGGRQRPGEFDLLIRVYSEIAADNLGNLEIEPASLRFTSGEGNQRSRPLAVLATQITWSESDNSLFCYQGLNNCQPQ
jgi:prepilin-type N-terminal cleavage/methylation domain-containing protein